VSVPASIVNRFAFELPSTIKSTSCASWFTVIAVPADVISSVPIVMLPVLRFAPVTSPVASTAPAVVMLPPATFPVAVIVVPAVMPLVISALSAATCPAVVKLPPATLPVAVIVVSELIAPVSYTHLRAHET